MVWYLVERGGYGMVWYLEVRRVGGKVVWYGMAPGGEESGR